MVILYKCKSMWKKNKYRTGLGMADNYRNVIANVSNMKNAKLAMEYLKSLGFDLSDLVKADENPVTTALSVEVDTRFLFIGGKKNEVE